MTTIKRVFKMQMFKSDDVSTNNNVNVKETLHTTMNETLEYLNKTYDNKTFKIVIDKMWIPEETNYEKDI